MDPAICSEWPSFLFRRKRFWATTVVVIIVCGGFVPLKKGTVPYLDSHEEYEMQIIRNTKTELIQRCTIVGH